MSPTKHERIEYLCKRMALEKRPQEFEKIAVELNDLASPIIKSVEQEPQP